jgi:hypothetical protein
VLGALWLGAIGVAIGTLIGSFVSIGVHFLYHMPRTTGIAINRPLLVKEGLVRPLICAVPFGLLLILQVLVGGMSAGSMLLLSGIAAICTCWLLWSFGLMGPERQKLERVFAS